ncbi:MAG: hypothetical protein LBI06_00840 [Treponema sp.]|jgi:hypothetical protein|nr:hypothetical protein [Treponema sp.]
MAGGLFKRYRWLIFRKRFDSLRLSPSLDYRQYSQIGEGANTFRFTGGFESVTDGQTLWIRGEDLTVPVLLKNAETYLLPMQKSTVFMEGGIPEILDPGDEAPEKIRWERVSALTEGARVFVGGLLAYQDGRWSFVSTKEKPLIVIFYDGPEHSLAERAIRAGRHRGEYWNELTPYSLVIGALLQIIIAVLFLSRPAFRLTVVVSMIALFVPLYPIIPPGLLFTVVYRRLAWRSRMLRAYRDLARLPLRYFPEGRLPNGELYGCVQCAELPLQAKEGKIPLLLPEFSKIKEGDLWHIFGALRPGEELPVQPKDSFATYGILPGKPETLAKRYQSLAYMLELAAWIILFAGIGLNIFFLGMILVLI